VRWEDLVAETSEADSVVDAAEVDSDEEAAAAAVE